MTRTLLIRGSTIDAARRFIMRDEKTPEYQALVERLTDEQRDLIDKPVQTKDWYPSELYIGVLEQAAGTVARGDPSGYLHRLGRFVLEDGANSLYRTFFRIASPGFVIRGSALLWGMFFKGNKLKVLDTSKRSVSAALVDSPVYSHHLCQSIVGGIEASLEKAGARDVRFELRGCTRNGESCSRCDFHFVWR